MGVMAAVGKARLLVASNVRRAARCSS